MLPTSPPRPIMGSVELMLLLLPFAYLLGSVPTSLLAGRLVRGIDVREHGSGNAGATNTFRVLGWKTGLAVALFDAGKGAAAVLLLPRLLQTLPFVFSTAGAGPLPFTLAGSAAVLGHVFPVFAGFRGGKGVATGAGVVFSLNPPAALISLGGFLLTLLTSGYVSLSSIAATVLLPVSAVLLPLAAGRPLNTIWVVFTVLVAALVVFLHRQNIRRLLGGTERRFEGARLLARMARHRGGRGTRDQE